MPLWLKPGYLRIEGDFEFSHPHPTLVSPQREEDMRLESEASLRASTFHSLLGSLRRSVVGWGSLGLAFPQGNAKGPASLGLGRPQGRSKGPASMGTSTHQPKGIPLLDCLTQSSPEPD